MIFFLSNVNSFWSLFRKKDIYEVKDTVPPTAPYLEPLSEATQSSVIDVKGQAEPGVKLILYLDDSKNSETVTDNDGSFAFTNIPVGVFDTKIYVNATDDAGNVSKPSITYDIKQDNEAPELEITTPKDGETYKSTGHSYDVTGKTEPRSTVLVNDQLAIMTPTGEFSASLRLEEGANTIKVVAKDKAENETEKSVYIKFEKIN